MSTQKQYLSSEKQTLLNAFISRAVMANASFEYSSNFGKVEPQTVQQLVHTNAITLKKIGMQLEKIVAGHGQSRFNKKNRLQIPAQSGIYAEEWLDFIDVCLERQDAIASDRETSAELKEIDAELEALETPDERKKKLLERRNSLTGATSPEPAAV